MPKSWMGQPVLPYAQRYVSAGNTVRLELRSTNVDREPVTPTTLQWRLDNLTNNVAVQGWTSETPGNPTVVTISAALNQMYGGSTFPGQDTQQMQVTVQATLSDGTQSQSVHLYSLNAIYQGQG